MTEITNVEEIVETYFGRNNNNGILTWTKEREIAKRYESLQQDIQILKNDKKKSLSTLKTNMRDLSQAIQKPVGKNAYIAFGVIFIFEILVLLFYRYQTSTFQKGLKTGEVQPWTVHSNQGTVSVPIVQNLGTVNVPRASLLPR